MPPGVGMQKGQKTKRSLETQEVYNRIVDKHGDPLLALAEMAFGEGIPLEIKQNSLKELVTYGHAKKRTLEVTGKDGSPLEVDVRLKLIGDITAAITQLGGG